MICASIEKVEGGFVIHLLSQEKTVVTTSLQKALSILKDALSVDLVPSPKLCECV